MTSPMVKVYLQVSMKAMESLSAEDRVTLMEKIMEVVCVFCGERKQTPKCPHCGRIVSGSEG